MFWHNNFKGHLTRKLAPYLSILFLQNFFRLLKFVRLHMLGKSADKHFNCKQDFPPVIFNRWLSENHLSFWIQCVKNWANRPAIPTPRSLQLSLRPPDCGKYFVPPWPPVWSHKRTETPSSVYFQIWDNWCTLVVVFFQNLFISCTPRIKQRTIPFIFRCGQILFSFPIEWLFIDTRG